MTKTFSSVREMFRHYIPGYIEKEEKERELGSYETREQSSCGLGFVEILLEDFRLSLAS